MAINVWAQVGAVVGYLPMTALTGLTGQLLGMNAGATAAEWKAATFLANQLAVPVGAVGTPSFTFTGDLNTGFYQDGVDKIGVAVGGAKVTQFAANGITFTAALIMSGKVFSEEKGADVVAAANLDLATATGNYIYVTNNAGDVSITRLGGVTIPSGTAFELKFVILGGTVTLISDPNFLSLLGGSDITVSNGDILRFRKTNDVDQFWEMVSISRGSSVQTIAAAGQPITYIGPNINDRPAITTGGWLPWNLNQQWGGAPMPFHLVDSATGTEFKFDAFDAQIDSDLSGITSRPVGNNAANFYFYQVLTPAKNLSLQAVWLKLYKILNPVDNLTVKLWSVAAGLPNALIATANVINGKQITSDIFGQWYRFSFAAVQALVGGTQYIITAEKSAGIDAANYYQWVAKSGTKYPSNLCGFGTVVPAWTAQNTISQTLICEAQASDQVVQTAGQFTGRVVGSEGNPINRSVAYCKPLREFFPLFDPTGWSIIIRGKTWTKDRPLCQLIYGLHHDRIDIRAQAGTGYPLVTVYESDNTITTVTGTSDISAATFKDVMIVGRSLNDGSDYIRIYTGIANVWNKEAESTNLSLIFDPLFHRLGTAWVMGGFKLFALADYTKLSDMTILPSGDGWAFTTTTGTVEGTVFAVAAGKLNQIKAGMAAGGDGYYIKAAAGFSNVNGWAFVTKLRIPSNTGTQDEVSANIRIRDGVKNLSLPMQEFYLSCQSTSTPYYQTDLKAADNTLIVGGKTVDALVFLNGRLVFDYTSFITNADATNQFEWGDRSVTANENADVVWDYIGYYNTANVYPQFTSGELHEFAVFSGDKNSIGQAVYNSGVPVSIKNYCGLANNYTDKIIQELVLTAIANQPSTASATAVLMPNMEAFVLGRRIKTESAMRITDTAAGAAGIVDSYVDGRPSNNFGSSTGEMVTQLDTANFETPVTNVSNVTVNYGLHKAERRFRTSGGTVAGVEKSRILRVEAST